MYLVISSEIKLLAESFQNQEFQRNKNLKKKFNGSQLLLLGPQVLPPPKKKIILINTLRFKTEAR